MSYRKCQWIDGEPVAGAEMCGKQTTALASGKEVPFCREHAVRVYEVITRDGRREPIALAEPKQVVQVSRRAA